MMGTVLLALLTFGLGAYISAVAAGIGGVPLAQTVATVVGLSAVAGATAVVMDWHQRRRGP